jgi:hypothetical protein
MRSSTQPSTPRYWANTAMLSGAATRVSSVGWSTKDSHEVALDLFVPCLRINPTLTLKGIELGVDLKMARR